MARYEQILNKISPIFYKLTESHMLRLPYNYRLLTAYLAAKHLPDTRIEFEIEELRNIFYIFGIRPTDFFKYKKPDFFLVTLETKNYAYQYYIDVAELIANLILNKFIFENEIIREATPPITFKDYVKAFIGNGLYDAIRSSIK